MTRSEAIKEACTIVAMAYHTLADYADASDGFCSECRMGKQYDEYRNDGQALTYIREAVRERLKRDGYEIGPQWSAE